MNITDIRLKKIQTEGKLRALVSITLDDAIAIHDIKVIQGNEKIFVAMPSKKLEDGTYKDIVHPISTDARQELEQAVLDKYNSEE